MSPRDSDGAFISTSVIDQSIAGRRNRDPRTALLRRVASRLGVGQIEIETPDGDRFSVVAAVPGPSAALVIHRWRMLKKLILRGDIGFAEAYMDGDWSSPDLAALIELAGRNEAHFATSRGVRLLRALGRLRHWARRNTRAGSRRNIAAHYDLGNEFYAQWLDPSMTYSSALFSRESMTLAQAQEEKIARATELLDVSGGEHVLEIGCGWGAMAEYLGAKQCKVTAITISNAQHAHAVERLRRAGLAAEVQLVDYRDVDGQYDRIVSIEMLEAVGEAHWPTYFATLRDRLTPGGVAVLQVITIDDERFENYRRTPDFIQRYIFPGGMLPSPTVMRAGIAQAGLVLASTTQFGLSYARTVMEWRERFHAAWPKIAAQGFPPRFRRMWDYYLAYCEAGFRTAAVDVGLYRIEKPL